VPVIDLLKLLEVLLHILIGIRIGFFVIAVVVGVVLGGSPAFVGRNWSERASARNIVEESIGSIASLGIASRAVGVALKRFVVLGSRAARDCSGAHTCIVNEGSFRAIPADSAV